MGLRLIAVDLGGTQIRAARYLAGGMQELRVALPTGVEDGPEAVLQRIRSAVQQVWPKDERVAGIGIGAPGPVDYKHGVIRFAPNIPGFVDVPLRDRLVEAFDVPVFVGNDADVAALGEHRFGAGQGESSMIYLTISTGIGGGIIIDNRLFTGGNGMGGEIGHMVMDIHGVRCGCGNYGCLETIASGTAIARMARERLDAGTPSLLREMVQGDIAQVTAKEVNLAAQQGDALAVELFELAGTYLGAAIVSLMYVINPALFVFGGSVTQAGELLFAPMRREVERRAPAIYRERTRFALAALGADVGLWGALALALTELDL